MELRSEWPQEGTKMHENDSLQNLFVHLRAFLWLQLDLSLQSMRITMETNRLGPIKLISLWPMKSNA